MPHQAHERADAFDARVVIGFAKIHGAAHLRVHFRAAEFFRRDALPDGRLHERRAGQKKPRTLGHQNVIAHHGQISATGDAHTHDGRDLGNAHGAHHRVVAENAAEVVGVRKDVFLQRQKNAGGIHQIDGRDTVFDGDILRANHFLGGQRKKCAGLHRGVVGNDHHQAARDARQAGDRARGRSAAPFLIHFVSGVNPQLEELCLGVDQPGDALARREPAFLVLRFSGFGSSALLQTRLFVFDFGEQVHHATRVLLEIRRVMADAGFQSGTHIFSG